MNSYMNPNRSERYNEEAGLVGIRSREGRITEGQNWRKIWPGPAFEEIYADPIGPRTPKNFELVQSNLSK